MLALRDFWRRHRRKVFIGAGLLGSGYVLYRVYHAHRRRIADLERELEEQKHFDEMIKTQMQIHYENVQRVADSITLPHAISYLSQKIEEELYLSDITERLLKGKGQPNTLSLSEKLELWNRLKILSFTKLVSSLWTTTMLTLYIRVQVNILGRHLYIDTAQEVGTSHLLEYTDRSDKDDLQNFLATSDYLVSNGLPALLVDMEAAAREVLEEKQLRDSFDTSALGQTIMQIVNMFMSMRSTHHWVDYLMPAETGSSNPATFPTSNTAVSSDLATLSQLMVETRAVLSGGEFGSIVEISLLAAVHALIGDIKAQFGGSGSEFAIPLAKLFPPMLKMCPLLLEEPSKNRFIQIISNIPEVDQFFSLLYANMSS